MKKFMCLVVAVVMSASLALAQEAKDSTMGGGMMGEGMTEKGMMGGGMMHGMMKMHGMQGMMGKSSMVASNDGGVIVMTGNKLYKYDSGLNLVKEVELKTPSMEDMQKMCPMCGAMMEKGGMMGQGLMGQGMMEGQAPQETGVETVNPADAASEHESHH